MSPHTDTGALLPVTMLVDATIKLNELLDKYWMGDNSKSNIIAMCAAQLECKQALDTVARQAASHGSAGGERAEVRPDWEKAYLIRLDQVIRLESVIRDSIEVLERNSTGAPVVECLKAALSPPVKTGGEAQASNGGTTYSPIGRNADGIEVYKRDARPVDAGAREVLEKVRRLDWSSNPGCSALRAEVDAILALLKVTAAGESAAVAQAPGDCGDWRPIETAPKDGSNIIVCRAMEDRSVGEAFFVEGAWRTWDGENHTRSSWIDGYLTHWRPMPKASSVPSAHCESTTVYLREVDAGTDSACWVVCNRTDADAVAFVGAA